MSNVPQRIRITEKGWNGYTGYFGGIEFVNGLSKEPVESMHSTRLGSLIRVQLVDSDFQAGDAANLQRAMRTEAEVIPESPRTSMENLTPAAKPAEPAPPAHTRESLEAVADKMGIAGLREIAEPMRVKGRGIQELIEEILKAQGA